MFCKDLQASTADEDGREMSFGGRDGNLGVWASRNRRSSREDVEPTAAVKRAVSSMGGKAGRTRLCNVIEGLKSKLESQLELRR